LECDIASLFGYEYITPEVLPAWLVPLYPDLIKLKPAGREAVKVVIRGYKQDDDDDKSQD
jgi:hypothetical protein